MKIRNGFVSNSSSSSFVIKIKNLTTIQLSEIKDYYFTGQKMGMNIPKISKADVGKHSTSEYFTPDMNDSERELINNVFCYINWDITEETDDDGDLCITGFTIIDNFSMSELFEKIGIDDSIIKWEN